MSLLTDHLDEVGETYFEHLANAVGYAAKMLAAAAICLVHALLPFLLVHAGSDRVRRISAAMAKRQQTCEEAVAGPSEPPHEEQDNGS